MITGITLSPGAEPFNLELLLTPTTEIVSEFFANTASLAQSEINFLLERGVAPLAFCNDPYEDGWAVGRAFVQIDAGRLFDFAREDDEGAVKALCIVARDVSGYPIDIVAWTPKEDRVAAHYGRVVLLGEQRVGAFRFDEPLVVHRSVLAWLRGERSGVVVVDDKRAWRVLEGVEVVAEDVEHGRHLRKMLSAPAPRILVRRRERQPV